MKLPLGIVATDLDNGQAILFQVGDPGLAVRVERRAGGFQPVRIGGREYVDGGSCHRCRCALPARWAPRS